MCLARKLFLPIAIGLLVMGAAATPAGAQVESVDVYDEDTGGQCSAVPNSATGGCLVHASGEASLVGHVFGIEATASDCVIELEARVDGDGEGYVYSASYSGDASHNCTRTPCGLPWGLHIVETGGDTERLETEFCARPSSGGDNRCLASIPMTDVGDHAYRFTLADVAGANHLGADCELNSGAINVEGFPHDDIEIVHVGDASPMPSTEVVQEDAANLHCVSVTGSTIGGCVIHGSGEFALLDHLFGMESTFTNCNFDFEARIDEAGEGYVYSATFSSDSTHQCTRSSCGLPWRIHAEEDNSSEILTFEFCMRPTSGSDFRCLVNVPIAGFGDHDYALVFNDLGGVPHLGSGCELSSGSVALESGATNTDTPHQEIEVIH
jgi:hypothetical protein